MLKKSQSHPRRVPGFLTVSQLAKQIGVPDHWIYDRIHKGVIQPLKGPKGIYVFPDTTETLTKFLDLKKLEFLEHS
jgi:hypothetical protein